MKLSFKLALYSVIALLLIACGGEKQSDTNANSQAEGNETVHPGSASAALDHKVDQGVLPTNQSYNTTILTDADGDINDSYYTSLYNARLGLKGFLDLHYHRVGCSSDTCHQEFITLAAVEYPQDTLLQHWMADILAHFYYDATRSLDGKVNGVVSANDSESETSGRSRGCAPYQGDLSDAGKAMFDYYQSRLWWVGKNREADEHGPSGRYLCTIYQCWQTQELSSWFVAYSTDDPITPTHAVVTFDRQDGHQLTLTEVINEDCRAEFQELLVEAAHGRYVHLRNSRSGRIAVEDNIDDNMADIQPNQIGFTEDGLAVSTGALLFDQWPSATHILILPYDKVNPLMQEKFTK